MANLVDQINEMIDILEVVNPKAAAAFRGGSQQRPMVTETIKESIKETVQIPEPPMPVEREPIKSRVVSKTALARIPSQSVKPAAFHLNLTADSLIQGIILSEVLGKPVSKRRGRDR